jgi:glyoxylase-like metal-dependent hydrolase (beta-lactamase superfamily II)
VIKSQWQPATAISSPNPEVHHFQGPASNWTVLTEGRDFTLVDCGYPADLPLVMASLEYLGLRIEHCQALLVTHAHVDHIGGAAILSESHGIHVWCSEGEARYLDGSDLAQVTLGRVLRNSWNPRVAAWAIHAVKAGGKRRIKISTPCTFTNDVRLDLPGEPRVLLTPGHTPGHAAFLLDQDSILLSGDAVITGHAISATEGVQMLHPMFHHDLQVANRTYERLIGAPLASLLPGHGKPISIEN